jgi:hypothetical protein
VRHRADVMRDRGGGKHLRLLLHTAEARVNLFRWVASPFTTAKPQAAKSRR